MTINVIAAVNRHWVIGKNGKIPWHHPDDLRRFKRLTKGGTVIMGRHTYESLGKPLPDRQNIVVSTTIQDKLDGCDVVGSVAEAMMVVAEKDVWFIGGRQIYREGIQQADKVYLTWVPEVYDLTEGGYVYFPNNDLCYDCGFTPEMPVMGTGGLIYQTFLPPPSDY